MHSNQQAYDRGVTVFSPDGRLYQVEYAREAVRRGSATVGVAASDSVVLAAHGPRRSSLMAADSVEKIHDVDAILGVATAGHVADGRRLVDYARQFAQRERLRYGEAPDAEPVAKAVADFIQESTQTGGTRPFGAALLVGGVVDGPALYEIEPSGTPTQWHAAAVGNGADAAREFMAEGYDPDLAGSEGVTLALRALAEATDEDLAAAAVGLAVLGTDGLDFYSEDRRAEALDVAGLGAS